LEYGWNLKWVPWMSLCAAIGFPIVMYIQEMRIHGNPGNVEYYLFASGFPLLLAVYLFIEFYFVKFKILDSTIFCESSWRKNRRIEVGDIVDVSFSHALKYYKLKTKNGDLIRVYMYMKGVPHFLDFLEKQLDIEIERY